MRLSEISKIFNATIIGDPNLEITGVKGIDDAQIGDITYIESKKTIEKLKNGNASAVITKDIIDDYEGSQLLVDNPKFVFAQLLKIFYTKPHTFKGISSEAYISKTAKLGKNVIIYPFAFIDEEVEIGDNTVVYPFTFIGRESRVGQECILYSNVTIRERVQIGNRVIIHSGAVIGSDGFGYIFYEGRHEKIPQVGTVIIEDDVEIGAGTTIDRATTGSTVIGAGTKIDNLVQIAHNVKIGKNCIIVAQVGIAGSSKIGDGCILAGQVGVADHAEIEAGTIITAQSGVMSGKIERGVYSGSPIMNHREYYKVYALFQKLPEMRKKIRELEEKIKKMEGGK
ncbi:UDP-3-O-(3-hydroxymyristoyl)glucosamine N-acyltransferase [Thermodesulfovibrio hydrogeniphilus]